MSAIVEYVTWTCKDGRVVRVVDMTDEHLVNAIRFCERAAEHRYTHQDVGAVDILEMCIMPYEMFLPSGYDDLVRAAKNRGIKL